MGTPPLGSVLQEIYLILLHRYGPQGWWPAETAFEVIVGAILTQRVAWSNVEKAIANLKRNGALTPEGLSRLSQERLAELIRPASYYNVKARKLLAFVEHLQQHHGGSLDSLFSLETPALRRELLSIYGIGPETADSILLYAAQRPVFVIDAYTRRILQRVGLISGRESYAALQALFMDSLPHEVDLFQEYHALLVRLGKEACRTRPLCKRCPLAESGHCSSARAK